MSYLLKTLREQAKQIANKNINGGGNTMLSAAEAIARLGLEVARLRGIIDRSKSALNSDMVSKAKQILNEASEAKGK